MPKSGLQVVMNYTNSESLNVLVFPYAPPVFCAKSVISRLLKYRVTVYKYEARITSVPMLYYTVLQSCSPTVLMFGDYQIMFFRMCQTLQFE